MKKLQLEPAFVLHRRDYQNTSLLVELFTQNEGRITVIAKGARRSKSPWRSVLHAFKPLMISCQGRTELLTLTYAECAGITEQLLSRKLICGLYINELLYYLLHRFDPHPTLFNKYSEIILKLANNHDYEFLLRAFEWELLKEIGYGIHFDVEAHTHKPIDPDSRYVFIHDQGFSRIEEPLPGQLVFFGSDIVSFLSKDFSNENVKKLAKQLSRSIFDYLIGVDKLRTRELF